MKNFPEWKAYLRKEWNPKEIEKPEIDPELPTLNALQRSAEVIRYWINGIEYWVSPKGVIREWFRWNLWVTFLLGIPAFFVVPILTYLLSAFTTWTLLLTEVALNLVLFPITVLLALALVSAIYFLIRGHLPDRFRRPRGGYPQDY